jgi:mannose-6-phosphate isomerase-like protein (cupin superfamily)
MTPYTHKNLKADVEDSAPKFGMSPPLEAHFAREALDCEKLGVSYLRLAPDEQVPFDHRHGEQEEVYVVVDGDGRVRLDDDVVPLALWDAVRIAPATTRNLQAGADGIAIVAVGAPNVGTGDAEMIQPD